MIRINLLPDREARRAGGAIDPLLLGFGAIAAFIVIMMGLWYLSIDTELSDARGKMSAALQRVNTLEAAKARLLEREAAHQLLRTQNGVFERMKVRTTGPTRMLQFIGYALTRPEENLYNRDEIAGHEKAGWATDWDPDNVWLVDLKEKDDFLVIEGRARDHEDVTEFQRRLASSRYFYCVDLIEQEKVKDPDFDALELTKFEIEMGVNFNPDGKLTMTRESMPSCLLPLIEQAQRAKKKSPAAGEKKKGGS